MSQKDPARANSLIRRYSADLVRRLNGLRAGVSGAVQRAFAFTSDARKVGEFLEWLGREIDSGILEVVLRGPRGEPISSGWQSVYIRAAADKAVRQATTALRAAGVEQAALRAMFQGPTSVDVLRLLYTRNFTALKGITDTMSSQMSHVLTEGLAQGLGPRQVARNLVNRIDSVAIVRARTLARTEIINALNAGALRMYEAAGIEGIEVEVEWTTTKDSRLCPICQPLSGKVFTLAEARKLHPPRHPNCRCVLRPYTEDIRRIRAERQQQAA